MGVSTDGQICYGIIFEEGTEFPWDSDVFDGDIDDWWIYGICGFRHSFEIYTPDGEYVDGVRPPQEKISEYFAEKQQFAESKPLPVKLVNYCSCDYPMYILAVVGTCNSARRGYPEEFNPANLTVTDEQKAELIKFCETYGIAVENEPAWYLSSLWC